MVNATNLYFLRVNEQGVVSLRDEFIVTMYWQRNEAAIEETKNKYGTLCYKNAFNILFDREDSEEAVNDTYLALWNTIPPRKPTAFWAYISKILRRICIDKLRRRNADKRGGGEYALAYDELSEMLSSGDTTQAEYDKKALNNAVNEFIKALNEKEQAVFLRRYFYFDSISEISERYGYSQSKAKSMLKRMRDRLYIVLKKEGYL